MPEETLDTSGFDAVFGIVTVVVVIGIVAVIVLIAVNAIKVRRAGHNPATLDADLAVRVLESELLAPVKSKEERLRELDELRARGVISAEEHSAARAGVLSAP
jgi:competence protein ComGC